MTEFLFDLFTIPVPIKFIAKFLKYKAMSYLKIWLFTECTTGCMCLMFVLENLLVRSTMVVTYNGIYAQL